MPPFYVGLWQYCFQLSIAWVVDPAMVEQIESKEDREGKVARRSPAAHLGWVVRLVREGQVVVKSGATR